MVHFYLGKGKGKTSAALGLCFRACGWGKRAYVAQFLKNAKLPCGEINAARKAKLKMRIERFPDQIHPMFVNSKNHCLSKTISSFRKSLMKIRQYIKTEKYDIIILDEIFSALHEKFLTSKDICLLIKESKDIELVLTGRTCPRALFHKADYVSFIKEIKHPYQKGIKARKGIEY